MRLIFIILGLVLINAVSESKGSTPSNDHAQKIDSLINDLYSGPFYADFEESIRILKIAEHIAKQHQLSAKLAEIYLNRCWLAQNFADLVLMKSEIEKAEPIIDSLSIDKYAVLIGDYYYSEASYLTRIGDFAGANIVNGKILNLPVEDSLLLYDTYVNIGYNFRKAGNPGRALESYEKALEYNPHNQELAQYLISESLGLQSVGLSYLDYFSYSKDSSLLLTALNYLRRALRLIEKSPPGYLSTINESSILNNLSRGLIHLNKLDSATILLERAGKLHDKKDAFFYFIEMNFAEIMMAKSDYHAAIDHLLKAERIALDRYEKQDFYVINNYTKLSEAYLKAGLTDNAEKILDAGLAAIKDLENDMSRGAFANLVLPFEVARSKVIYERHKNSVNVSDLDASLNQYVYTIELVREVRKVFPDRSFKEFLSSDGKQLASRAIDLCFNAYQLGADKEYIELAFQFSEVSRALTLLETTIENNAVSFAGIPDIVVQKGVALQRALAEVEIAIKAGSGTRADLESINRSYQSYIGQLEKEYPEYYELKYDVNIPDLSSVSASLTEKEQILHFFSDEQNTFLISIFRDQLRFEKLNSLKASDVNQLFYCLQTNPLEQNQSDPYDQFLSSSRHIYRLLLKDRINPGIEEVIIIPDGILHLIPFETLAVNQNKLLIEEYSVRYDVSVSLMHYRLNHHETSDGHYIGFAPQYNGEKVVELRSEKSSEVKGRLTLGKLRYNEAEVQSLSHSLGGKFYKGDDASKSNFIAQAGNSSVFHLSAHGLYNDRSPLYSAIYFSQKDSGVYKSDNTLFAFEIYGANLKADLGILSSCESGFGQYQFGEGLNSLRRAFYFAGCKSIVSSLWNANDKATYQIIEAFGDNLADGEEKSIALRNAKLSFLAKNKATFRHPYFWAHLTFSGDKKRLNNHSAGIFPWLILLLVLVSVFGILIIMRKRVN